MKRLLTILLLCWSWSAWSQPILKQSATTNNPPKIFVSFPGPGVGGTVANPVFADSSNVLWQLDGSLTDVHLHLTNVFGDVTNTYNTINVTNLNVIQTNVFNVGKGGHLFITNITILTNGTFTIQNLPLPAVLVVLTNGIVTNATLSGITQSSDGQTLTVTGGDTTATNIVTLTQNGTNISQLDFALVARGGTFKLNLTNTGYIGAPANVNNTDFKKCTLMVQQPSTGTCFLTFSNGFWEFPEGVAPIIDTNNGAITTFEFKSDLFTNGLVQGWMSLKGKLVP